MKVVIVAEYYPRAADPTLGVWAHHQTRAARDAGADVRVIVLHRPVPPLAAMRGLRSGSLRSAFAATRAAALQPSTVTLDGISVHYLRYLSPPRARSYASWGAWAAPRLRRALRRLRVAFPFDLIHAHYAVPAGDAVASSRPGRPARGLGSRRRRARRARGRADRGRDARPRAARAGQQRRDGAPLPTTAGRVMSRWCTSAPTLLQRPRRPRRPRRW